MHPNRTVPWVLALCLLSAGTPQVMAQAQQAPASASANPELDKLLAPIALYPDSLLAQVLACSSSPEQVTEVNKWLEQNKNLQGTELQEAAKAQQFDASFVALIVFPDVLALMGKNLQWTTEVGKAFVSDQKGVLASVQRLREQAQAAGNLKTTEQQTVTTQTEGGQQVIVIQPANPQVIYVPQYDSQAAYSAPPPQDNSGEKLAAGLIGFGLGIALGAAMNDDYYHGPYGYGGWGMGWHGGGVVVVGGAWRVPPGGRYGYVRPVPYRGGAYRPNNVYAPRYNNVNVNVDRSRSTNVNRPTTVNNARGTAVNTRSTTSNPARTGTGTSQRPSQSSGSASRGYSSGASTTQARTGTKSNAFSGYQSGQSERAASQRGQRSAAGGGRSASGGGRRR